MKASKFTLEIELGNDAMQTGADIARKLREIASEIKDLRNPKPTHSRSFRDENGNRVGQYNFEADR